MTRAEKENIEKCWEYIVTHYGWAMKKLAEGPDAPADESEGEESPSEEH